MAVMQGGQNGVRRYFCSAGESTGGRNRQWKDQDGNIRRRWDADGGKGNEGGPHWHDSDDPSGGGFHIEPDR